MNDDARPSRVNASGRALLVVAVVALAAAATFALMAVRGGATPEATLVVEPAVAAEPPTTIAPLAASEPAPAEAPIAPVDPAAGDEPSSLAALVGPRGSAIPKAYTRLVIRSVALEDDGEMEVPDETEVGWYELGAAPGEAGATVLAAHVTWNDTVGPFHKLGELEPGAEIRMRLSDGSTRIYEVVERTMFRKDELPNWRIFRRDGPESLVLITCGGSFNENVRRYRDNIVVFAVPVGAEPAPAA
jgi:LPXTG-site transpeptidase (sortase) family protein